MNTTSVLTVVQICEVKRMIDEKKLIEVIKNVQNTMRETNKKPVPVDAREIFTLFIGMVEKQPKVGEWIPVSERLPNGEDGLYWTTHEDGSLILHGYTKNNGFIYNWEVDDLEKRKRQGEVIAWMLIPEPEPYRKDVE